MMDILADIDIKPGTAFWGPYAVDLAGGIPPDAVIAAITVRAHPGRVTPEMDTATMPDLSQMVIVQGSVGFAGWRVWWRMQYAPELAGKDLTLVFDVTTTDGGRRPFYLYRARIQ